MHKEFLDTCNKYRCMQISVLRSRLLVHMGACISKQPRWKTHHPCGKKFKHVKWDDCTSVHDWEAAIRSDECPLTWRSFLNCLEDEETDVQVEKFAELWSYNVIPVKRELITILMILKMTDIIRWLIEWSPAVRDIMTSMRNDPDKRLRLAVWKDVTTEEAMDWFTVKDGKWPYYMDRDNFMAYITSICAHLPRDKALVWVRRYHGNKAWDTAQLRNCPYLVDIPPDCLKWILEQLRYVHETRPRAEAALPRLARTEVEPLDASTWFGQNALKSRDPYTPFGTDVVECMELLHDFAGVMLNDNTARSLLMYYKGADPVKTYLIEKYSIAGPYPFKVTASSSDGHASPETRSDKTLEEHCTEHLPARAPE